MTIEERRALQRRLKRMTQNPNWLTDPFTRSKVYHLRRKLYPNQFPEKNIPLSFLPEKKIYSLPSRVSVVVTYPDGTQRMYDTQNEAIEHEDIPMYHLKKYSKLNCKDSQGRFFRRILHF
ncbi:hypothetical protein EGCR1_17375 (plasmid) [Enterococcus gilvus]|jgi:hypothetical protein|uniref:hypothetical protein n=1 Tax=Enterococcus gilvus TaxID=160453 RepID=UPI000DF60ADA|nr:hypothetical protein [Enterococcus gilvus]AXG40473.1 hypothetical protein EGCR1_17375 [Enterococcus gilvus]